MTHYTNVFSAGFPPDYTAFLVSRQRFLDQLAAEAAARRARSRPSLDARRDGGETVRWDGDPRERTDTGDTGHEHRDHI